MGNEYSLYYMNFCIVRDGSKKEIEAICDDLGLKIDWNWELEGRYDVQLGQGYWCSKELSF